MQAGIEVQDLDKDLMIDTEIKVEIKGIIHHNSGERGMIIIMIIVEMIDAEEIIDKESNLFIIN